MFQGGLEVEEYAEQMEFLNVEVDGLRIPAYNVKPVNLARYQGKTTNGDYTADSDDTQSSFVQRSFRAGGQKLDATEGADDDRFFDSTLETTYPNQLCLQLKTYDYAGPVAETAKPLGDFNDTFYMAFGSKVCKWNAGTKSFANASLTDMPAQPTRDGIVVWCDQMYIPHGSAGYSKYDGIDLTVNTTIHATTFIVWDNKLLALTTEGNLSILPDPIGTWAEPTGANPPLRLPSGYKPRGMEIYVNQSGEDAVHILTDSRIFVYDPDVPKLYASKAKLPPHPDMAQGYSQWRSESLYISAGVGVYEYNGTVIAASGLDRDDGLPSRYRGNIVDLTPEHNSLLALVAGAPNPTLVTYELSQEEGTYTDIPLEVDSFSTESCMWEFTGGGWHNRWTSKDKTGLPTWIFVSIADNDYRLWWGFGTRAFTKKLRRNFHTPLMGFQVGLDEFERTGYLITPIFDATMRGFPKVASHFEVYLKDARGDGKTSGDVRISYRTNLKTQWQSLGTASIPGRTVMPMPNFAVRGISEGEKFNWIQFKYDLEQTVPLYDTSGNPVLDGTGNPMLDVKQSPIVDTLELKYTKFPLSGRSWIINCPMGMESWHGNSMRTISDKLNGLVSDPRFVSFVHKDSRYRVVVAQIQQEESTGKVPFGSMNITLLEIAVPPSSFSSDYGIPIGGVTP